MPKAGPTEVYNLKADVAAAALAASPSLTRIAQVDFPYPYLLEGVLFSSSLLNFGTTELGVFLITGQSQKVVQFSETTKAIVQHVTLNNSLTGPPVVPVPTNKATPISFRCPIRIGAKSPIGLYTFGDTTAGNRVLAYVSLFVAREIDE